MRIRFWGTRGSIPKPGPATVRYGGNTSCVEVRTASGGLILLDCGTGAHALGQALLAEPRGPRRGHVLISHTHWDHIQGLPFLAPLFVSDFEWDIYGPRGLGPSIRETLAGQMQYTYFPITIEQFAAKVRYHDLVEGSLEIDDVRISAHYMNHPALTLGYRIEADGACVVYATDHEPHTPALARGERPAQTADECQYAAFIEGADLLIHDAQFTLDEYENHRGWGHSPVEFAVDLAIAGRVRQLALFHHDPLRDDAGVDRLVERARERAAGAAVEVFGAAEGLEIELHADAPARAAPDATAARAPQALPGTMDRVVLIAVDPEPARVLAATVRADGARLLSAADPDSMLRLMAAEKPSLVLLQRQFGGRDAIELCRLIRGIEGSDITTPVVVVVASRQEELDEVAGTRAGVTDWLLWPFKETYARTKMHSWALRQACRWSPAPLPQDEEQRLLALQNMQVLDTPAEERFDRYTRIAAELFDVPIALVSLVDRERQWFKSRHGLAATETPRETAFCAHAILAREALQVPDALQDPRFADNPLVTGPPRVRFYAGAPLAAADGSLVGTLCLIDQRARRLDEQQLGLLRDLANLVEAELANPSERHRKPTGMPAI
jgi:phosphoribosyl 1,2-cyclic phosphodiesterase/DNA-binding response OmpR family regulator